MDLVVGVERVQVLALVQVPQHGGAVLAARGAERAVGGDGDGVDVTGVTDVVGLELAARKLPDLFVVCAKNLGFSLSVLILRTVNRSRKRREKGNTKGYKKKGRKGENGQSSVFVSLPVAKQALK